MLRRFMCGAAALSLAASLAQADVVITEWVYSGASGEFIEFTNVGAAPVDLTGWSYDDDSAIPGSVDLSPLGIVDPGESVILTEIDAATFIAEWGLAGVGVLGGNMNNLGRNDQINLFDDTGALVDRLTYGDQTFAGSIRTQNVGGIPSSPAALGADDVYLWQLAAIGDGFGSYASASGDVGNPGVYIPEPAAAFLLLTGALAIRRR